MATSRYTVHEYHLTPVQIAARITLLLAEGETLTARDIADRFGLTVRDAQRYVDSLSFVLPIFEEQQCGCAEAYRLLPTKQQGDVS